MEQENEIKKLSLSRNAMYYGSVLGIALIIFSLLMYIFNVDNKSNLQYFSLILIVTITIIGILNYRNNINGGFINYGKSVGIGVLIGLFASFLFAFYTFIFYKFVAPEMINEILKKTEENMLDQNPTMSDEQIELAMSYTRKFTTPLFMSISTIFGTTFMSFLLSLIISIFTRKKDNSFESNFR